MYVFPLEPITATPVTLSEAKSFLRLSHDAEDPLLQNCLESAVTQVESYLSRILLERNVAIAVVVRRYLAGGPLCHVWHTRKRTSLFLPLGPVKKILSVEIVKENGVYRQVMAEDIHFNDLVEPGLLVLNNVEEPWGIKIQCRAGYGNRKEDVPAPIRQAILRVTSALYEHRQEAPPALPDLIHDLVSPYRCRRVTL